MMILIALIMIAAATTTTTTGGAVEEDMVGGGVIAVSETVAGAKLGGYALLGANRPSDDDLLPIATRQ